MCAVRNTVMIEIAAFEDCCEAIGAPLISVAQGGGNGILTVHLLLRGSVVEVVMGMCLTIALLNCSDRALLDCLGQEEEDEESESKVKCCRKLPSE